MTQNNTEATSDETKKTKTERREEEVRAFLLKCEEWGQHYGHDYRSFQLPDRARAHLLKYGSIGREMMHRAECGDNYSVQVYFGYRRALVAEFWPLGQSNGEDPNGTWELDEYRWKSEEGREAVRLEIDESIECIESEAGPVYLDPFYSDVECPLSTADASSN